MLRFARIALGVALISSLSTGYARAQWGYGWGGWGGWGGGASSLQGDILHGAGVFAAGAGQYNYNTAVANSINEDTWQRWNQYWFLSERQAAEDYYRKKYAGIANNKAAYNAIQKRIEENPTQGDIMDGDAFNKILEQFSDPRISSSALRMAAEHPVDAQLIRDIPFRYNSEAVTIVLSEMKKATTWPAVLDTPRFAEDKKTFEELADQARKEDEAGDIASSTLTRAKNFVADLRAKLEATPLAEKRDQDTAQNWLKALTGLVRMLEKPNTKEVLDELRKVKTAPLAALVGFMHVFNLRFGVANSPRERFVYSQLWPIMDDARDKIIGAVQPKPGVEASPKHVVDLFTPEKLDNLSGKKKPTPEPPKPQQ
jgi:hypothetical protein